LAAIPAAAKVFYLGPALGDADNNFISRITPITDGHGNTASSSRIVFSGRLDARGLVCASRCPRVPNSRS